MRAVIMTREHALQAASWMTRRIRTATGNGEVVFDAMWFIRSEGIAVLDASNHLVAVVVLYLERGGTVGQIGWCLAKPGNTGRESYAALKLGLRAAVERAQKLGVKYLMSYIALRGINRELDRIGFRDGDQNIKQKILVLR